MPIRPGLYRRLLPLALAGLLACGDESGPLVPDAVSLAPARMLLVSIDQSFGFQAAAWDDRGRSISEAVFTWSTTDSAVAVISSHGVVTAISAGVTEVFAESAGVRGSATLEVYLAPERESYDPDSTYWSRSRYGEYVPGELPVVLSAPHGGAMRPHDEIPDRTYGVTGADRNTAELIRAIRDAVIERTGLAPHVVISRLHRSKLDPNREIVEAAQGNVFAENAWAEYHGFIDDAKAAITERHGAGLYLDIHGHGHPIARLELGYLLTSSDLANGDPTLNATSFQNKSSLRALAATLDIPFSQLVRGPTSFGAYLQAGGFRAVPSPEDPSPGANPFFSGGYSTYRHGSRTGGQVSGIQIEHEFPGVRDSDGNRRVYAAVLAHVIELWMMEHFGMYVPGG